MRNKKSFQTANPKIYWIECPGCKDLIKCKDTKTKKGKDYRLCHHCGYIISKAFIVKNKFKG